MEHRRWSWRRKPCEKVIVANGRASLSLERNVREYQDTETGSNRCPSNLSERLSSVFCDCSAKEELVRKHTKMTEQALAGQQIAEAEVAFLKQELDKALQQGAAAEKRLAHLDTALKDCMQEIESLQAQQDGRIRDSLSNAAEDFEKMQQKLEGKLAESNKRVSSLTAENSNLMKALLCKEKLIEDLDRGKLQLEAELGRLLARLDSTVKENTYLKYDCNMIEEELKRRNEERKYNHRSALENAKQIKSLEAECQQLRDLVRKRLQGPAVALNMKKPSRCTGFLIERVYDLEEENKTLREILSLTDSELQSWRIKYGEMASRLAEVEAQLRELLQSEQSMQLTVSGFGVGNDDKIDDSETWANALLAELEQFKKRNIKNEPEWLALETVPMKDLVIQSTSKELVPQGNTSSKTNSELLKCGSWLDEVLKVILEEHRVSKRSFVELLRDIKIVVGCKDDLSKQEERNMSNISGLLPWKSSNSAYVEDHICQAKPNTNISLEEESHSITDASLARDKIRKHFGFDRSISGNQLDAAPNRRNTLAQMMKIQSALQEDKQEAKEKLQVVNEENVELKKQLQESHQTIEGLRKQVEILRETKGTIEEQIENQRSINEDLDTQLTVARANLNEILHKLSSLEVELEDKNNSCEELETTCLELQLQLETISRNNSPNPNKDLGAKTIRTEMIQNLGSQLNALASPDNMLLDKVLCPTTTTMVTKSPVSDEKSLAPQRSSLRDRMLADNNDQTAEPKSPKTTEELSHVELQKPPSLDHHKTNSLCAAELKASSPALAVVPSKRSSGGFSFIRKMFLRRKKGCSKMKSVPLHRNTSALIGPRNVVLLV